jgi:hypothetical protein
MTQSQSGRLSSTIGQSRSAYVPCRPCVGLRITSHDRFHFQELTFIIKQDIANLNRQIANLQAYVKQRNGQSIKSAEGKQIDEHNSNVVMLLQSKLASTSMSFKDVLEIRTQVRLLVPATLPEIDTQPEYERLQR